MGGSTESWTMRSSKKLLYRTWAVAVLSFFLHLCVICLAVAALATPHWIDIDVDRQQLIPAAEEARRRYDTNSSLYYTRSRGIFVTCYEDEDAAFLRDAQYKAGDSCIWEQGFKLKQQDTADGNSDSKYTLRTHLLRLAVSIMCLNDALLVVTFVAAMATMGRGKGQRMKKVAACVFGNTVLNAVGMVLFQYINYLEEQEIVYEQFPAGWKNDNDHALLSTYASTSYGYSYVLGWLGFALNVVPPVMYLLIARTLIIRRRDETTKLLHRMPASIARQKTGDRPKSERPASATSDIYYTSSMERNPAYDLVQKPKRSDHKTI